MANMKHREAAARSKTSSCEGCTDSSCSVAKRQAGEDDKDFEERRELQSRLCRIRHKIMVMSGKGGVGKSTVAVNLAMGLMLAGKKVGLLDVDIHGPSVPTMLGLEGASIEASPDGLLPVEVGDLKVMSMGFLLRNPDDAVIWRGPVKGGVIKQFLKDVAWGDLDYLIIDAPPGTGDEPLSVCQLINPIDGAVVVTTPQRVAAMDVRKSITFCAQVGMRVLGVVENMSGFVCPKCGEVTQILRSGGGRAMAQDMGVPFMGSLPIDPLVAESGDEGRAFVMQHATSHTAELMRSVVATLLELPENGL